METENATSVMESNVQTSSETKESDQSCQQEETKNENLERLDGESIVNVSGNNDSESEQGAVGGSEETFETVCKPCFEDDKHIESFQYCVDCNEYLCEPCVVMHRGVRLTRRHELVPKESVDKSSGERISSRELCSLHMNEYIDWFCVKHDVLCCIVCKAIGHGNCTIRSLKEACSDYNLDETITKLEETKSLLCNTILSRQTLQENLKNDKELSLQTLQKIDEDTDDVFRHIKSLVQKDREKTERTCTKIQKEIYSDIERHNQIKYSLESSLNILKSKRSREFLFVQGKKAEVNLRQLSENLSESQTKHFRKIELEPEQELDVHFKALKAMNMIGRTDKEKTIYRIINNKKVVITPQPSHETCDITSMCFAGNNQIIAADWQNDCLYLLDNVSFDVKGTVEFIHSPFDVCKVEDEFAVTLLHGHAINFVSLRNFRNPNWKIARNKFEDTKPIDTVEKCRGICYDDNKKMLFVCCGGFGLDSEGPGHIRVYNTEKKHVNTLVQNVNRPWKIGFHKVTNSLLVCDDSLLTIQENSSSQYVCRILKPISGKELCFDQSGRIIRVRKQITSDVSLFTRNGDLLEILITNNLLAENVSSIIFDEPSCCMYISFNNSNFIQQFKLEVKDWKYGPSVQ